MTMQSKGFAAGLGAGALAGVLIILASGFAGGGVLLTPAATQTNAAGSAQSASTNSVTSSLTATYSSTTPPATQQNGQNATRGGGGSFSATAETPRGTFLGAIMGVPASSSLSTLQSQPASIDVLILLPLALALLAGAAIYRFAGKKEPTG